MVSGEIGQGSSLCITERKMIRLQEHPSALLRVRFVVHAAAYVVNQGRELKKSTFDAAQAMKGPGQIEQLRRDRGHPTFVLDRTEIPQNPFLDWCGCKPRNQLFPRDGNRANTRFAAIQLNLPEERCAHHSVGRKTGPWALLIPRSQVAMLADPVAAPIIPPHGVLSRDHAR